jgi:tape measure domain-containing protein
MAQNSLANLNVRLGFVFDQKSLTRVERQLRTTGDRLARTGSNISLFISAPLALLGSGAIKAAGEFESLRLAMEATFKNAGRTVEEARAEVEALRKAALAPGLDFPQAVAASIRLQSVGLNAETARTTIQELANAIASTGGTAQNLESVTVQMAQMISKGKVLSQDLRIIQENLPIISDLMLKAFGTANAEKIQELGITGKDFVKGITAEMTKLTRVQGGISNALVNAGSAIKQALAGIGDEIARVFDIGNLSDSFSAALHSIVEGFKGLSDGTKKAIVFFAAFLTAIGPIALALGAINSVGSILVGTWASVAKVVTAAATAFRALNVATQNFLLIGIVTAILALAYNFGLFNTELSAAEKTQRSLNRVQSEAESAISAEKTAIGTLIGVLDSETSSREAKAKALTELKKISPEYFGQLRIENGLVNGLTTAYEAYISNILLAAKAKKAEEGLIRIDEEKNRLIAERVQLSKEAERTARAEADARNAPASFAPGVPGFNAGAAQARLRANEEQVKALDLEAQALFDVSQAYFEASAKVADNTKKIVLNTGSKKDQEKAAKDIAKAEQELIDKELLDLKMLREIEQAWKDEAVAAKKAIADIKAANQNFEPLAPRNQSTVGAPTTISDEQISAFDRERAAHDQLMQDFKDSRIAAAVSIAESVGSVFSAFSDKQRDKELADLETKGAAQLAAAQGNATLQAAIQSDLDAKRAAIEKKSAARQKKFALAEALINTYVAITKAIASAPPPFNIPAIVAASVAGFAQVANIAAHAKGTRDAPGGLSLVGEKGAELINLPRHSQVFPAHQTSSMLKDVGGSAMSLSGEFSVRGSDLILVLDRVQQKQTRQR